MLNEPSVCVLIHLIAVCPYQFFFNIHLGFSFNFTVVYLCQIMGGIPPPSGGIVGKNRSTRNIFIKKYKCSFLNKCLKYFKRRVNCTVQDSDFECVSISVYNYSFNYFMYISSRKIQFPGISPEGPWMSPKRSFTIVY